MDWKEFLKPDWKKIVIFIIFAIISLVLSRFILKSQPISDVDVYVNIIFVAIFLPPTLILSFIQGMIIMSYAKSLTPSEFGELITSGTLSPISSAFNVLGWILNVVYWYLLSCLIVWIYDKIKKR